ncbi:TraB/GumN family protein [Bacterioplanoides sp.]|uniref:TraB/GumN family protein n=1 Tax=Bacterioplanoides sp. TaxID=2066072 RepID=UPI003B0026F0
MRLILSLIFSFICLSTLAETSLWKVSNGDKHIYLGGTFHMLAESDYPLPAEFEATYQKVNWLVFETDISALESAEFQQQFQQAFLLPAGETLKTALSDTAFQQLSDYCQQNQIDLRPFMPFKPQFISLIIVVQELQKYGLTAEGVDNYFYNKAKADNKLTTQLESPNQQLHFLANMAEGNEDNLIQQTLADAKELESMMDGMRKAWRDGDATTLNTLGIQPMQQDYPKIYQSLLVERNNNWMPRIETLLTHREPKLVLVGALHLAGRDGLLTQLKNKGYHVAQVQ